MRGSSATPGGFQKKPQLLRSDEPWAICDYRSIVTKPIKPKSKKEKNMDYNRKTIAALLVAFALKMTAVVPVYCLSGLRRKGGVNLS